jgi:hypothetical protein
LSRRALAARAKFAIDGPPWAQPLPTSWQKVDTLARVGELIEAGVLAQDYYNGRMELMINFIASWCSSKWDPEHPSFHCFARGKMADRNTPHRLRNNSELRRQFPPQRLPSLMSSNMAMALDISEALVATKRLRESNT